jgi:protein-disulfide isomerase
MDADFDEDFLTPPVNERDHTQGPADAAVTLVEFGDYECSYCGRAYPIIKEVQAALGDRLRFAFRNFPITTSHPHAQHAAEAAEAAGAQGKFWEMHDMLYENQNALADSDLEEYARRVGLDLKRFAADMRTHKYAQRVREDFRDGLMSGVNGTPTFFINETRYDGSWEAEALTSALVAAMDAPVS